MTHTLPFKLQVLIFVFTFYFQFFLTLPPHMRPFAIPTDSSQIRDSILSYNGYGYVIRIICGDPIARKEIRRKLQTKKVQKHLQLGLVEFLIREDFDKDVVLTKPVEFYTSLIKLRIWRKRRQKYINEPETLTMSPYRYSVCVTLLNIELPKTVQTPVASSDLSRTTPQQRSSVKPRGPIGSFPIVSSTPKGTSTPSQNRKEMKQVTREQLLALKSRKENKSNQSDGSKTANSKKKYSSDSDTPSEDEREVDSDFSPSD